MEAEKSGEITEKADKYRRNRINIGGYILDNLES